MSVTSRSVRTPTITNAPAAIPQQKRVPKKPIDDRVTLFAHLTLYTRNLETLHIKG
jgi:hypothetical protein